MSEDITKGINVGDVTTSSKEQGLVPDSAVELQNPIGDGTEHHPSGSSTGSCSNTKDSGHAQQVEYYCGVGRCRPSWMQRLRDARFFTFLLCLNCFVQGSLVSGK